MKTIISYWIGFALILVMFAINLYISNGELVQSRSLLQNEISKNSTCNYLTDSLHRMNTSLSKFKTLTFAMIHRDESVKELKHQVGDIVTMKSDSVKGVIEDVIIGGGKYSYYIKYRVLFSDKTTREVIPELIFN